MIDLEHAPVLLLAILLVPACGGAQPAAAGPGPEPAASSPSAVAGEPAAAPTSSEPAPVRTRKPFAIHNGCADTVTVVFGADPKDASANRRTLTGGADGDGPRDEAGNQLVWLLDENGEPLVKVSVTRGMKRVEVGRSCRTLESH